MVFLQLHKKKKNFSSPAETAQLLVLSLLITGTDLTFQQFYPERLFLELLARKRKLHIQYLLAHAALPTSKQICFSQSLSYLSLIFWTIKADFSSSEVRLRSIFPILCGTKLRYRDVTWSTESSCPHCWY